MGGRSSPLGLKAWISPAGLTHPTPSPLSPLKDSQGRKTRFSERDAGGRKGAKREALPYPAACQEVTSRLRYAVGRSVALRARGQA